MEYIAAKRTVAVASPRASEGPEGPNGKSNSINFKSDLGTDAQSPKILWKRISGP